MTVPTREDFPALGFVPCPGDYMAVDRTARSIRHTSHALGEIKRVLEGAADGDWRGKAAIKFRELLDDDFRPKVGVAYNSFDAARKVIEGWSDYMEDQQRKARDLEREAAEAEAAEAEKAEKAQGGKGAGGDGKSGSGSGEDALEEVRRRARVLHEDYEDEGRRAANRLQKAIDIAPDEPGFWEKLGEAAKAALDAYIDLHAWLHDQAIELLGKLAPALKLLGDIAGLLSTITGLLAFIPGLQFLGPISLILTGVALGAHYLSAVGTTGSFGKALLTKDVLMDAAGLGLGKVGVKIGDTVLAAAKASGNSTRVVPQLIGDAVEMPQGFFQLARNSYSMGDSEMAWRAGGFFATWGGHGMTAEGSDGSIDTAKKIFSGDFGALTEEPKVTT